MLRFLKPEEMMGATTEGLERLSAFLGIQFLSAPRSEKTYRTWMVEGICRAERRINRLRREDRFIRGA
jgi:hypothetical protein